MTNEVQEKVGYDVLTVFFSNPDLKTNQPIKKICYVSQDPNKYQENLFNLLSAHSYDYQRLKPLTNKETNKVEAYSTFSLAYYRHFLCFYVKKEYLETITIAKDIYDQIKDISTFERILILQIDKENRVIKNYISKSLFESRMVPRVLYGKNVLTFDF